MGLFFSNRPIYLWRRSDSKLWANKILDSLAVFLLRTVISGRRVLWEQLPLGMGSLMVTAVTVSKRHLMMPSHMGRLIRCFHEVLCSHLLRMRFMVSLCLCGRGPSPSGNGKSGHLTQFPFVCNFFHPNSFWTP